MSVRKTRPTMIFLRAIISCILLMKETGAADQLNKPYLEVLTSYPDGAIVIGGMVQFHCKNSTNAEKFYLTKDQNDNTRSQSNAEFAFVDLKSSDSGLYSCKYSSNNLFSEPSEPQDIYVNDKYPPPQITVRPRKIVQPGEDITITCATPYSNMQFTIYKNGQFLEDGKDNPFSYFKRKAGAEDSGQYACDFRTKPDSKTPQMQSDLSDYITIKVIGLDSPSAWMEKYGGDNKTVKITCQAPVTAKMMWFQLLNSSEGIEEEIEGVVANQVTFNISPDYTQQKYYCVYAMRIGSNLAFSAISKPVFIWGVDSDYTTVNMIRTFISALVLILLGVILMIHFNVFQKTEEILPELPPPRRHQAEQSEYAEMVIMNTENVMEENEISSAGDKVEEL